MANFKTHLFIASTASGLASVAVMAMDLATPTEIGRYFSLGVAGGLLPDIDSDYAVPTKLFFSFLGLWSAFWAVLWALPLYSFSELAIIWGVIFILIRYALFEAFIRLTVHRGVFHSCLAAVFFTLLTANISHNVLAYSSSSAWMSGCFVGMGYLVHLTLDELYSVDLMNKRVKKSAGTALKLASLNNIKTSLLMLLLTVALYFMRPETHSFQVQVAKRFTHYSVQNRWLPQDNQWFRGLSEHLSRCALTTPQTPDASQLQLVARSD